MINVPKKYSVVGYWDASYAIISGYLPPLWRDVSHYLFLEATGPKAKSYWAVCLEYYNENKRVRLKLNNGVSYWPPGDLPDSILVTEEEYNERRNQFIKELEQKKLWDILNQK